MQFCSSLSKHQRTPLIISSPFKYLGLPKFFASDPSSQLASRLDPFNGVKLTASNWYTWHLLNYRDN